MFTAGMHPRTRWCTTHLADQALRPNPQRTAWLPTLQQIEGGKDIQGGKDAAVGYTETRSVLCRTIPHQGATHHREHHQPWPRTRPLYTRGQRQSPNPMRKPSLQSRGRARSRSFRSLRVHTRCAGEHALWQVPPGLQAPNADLIPDK